MATELYGRPALRTARKSRPCNWCNERIEPGDRYYHYWGPQADDSQPAAYDDHEECQAAIDREDRLFGDEISWGDRHRRGMTLDETERADNEEDSNG